MRYEKSELKELYQMMFPEYPDIMTVAQLQQTLGVSHALAYKLIGDGYIPAVKTGSAFKIPKIDVVGFVMEEGERRAG